MKIIDLLNKIANGEEVPYRIKYNGRIYEYADEIKWYLRDDMKCELTNSNKCLNDEVEIIEEDNKIDKIERLEYSTNFNRKEFMLYQNILAVNGNVNDLIDRVYELEKRYEKQDK